MIRNLLLSATALTAMLPGVASASWYQASSKHFVVYANDKPENVKAYTQKLERFDRAIRLWHKAPEVPRGPAARVTIFVLDDISAINKLAGNDGVAGFYSPRASGSVAFTPRDTGQGSAYGFTSQAVLFHEYTHHWMLTTWADSAFPAWFTEGFAELHATAIIKPDGSVIFGANPTYRQWTVGRVNLLPVDELLQPNPGKLKDEARDALYARGWLLMDYLTFDDARRKELGDYVGAINAGKPIEEATKVFGNINGLDGKMNAWGRQTRLPSAQVKVEDSDLGAITLRALTDGEAAVMPALITSKRGVDEKVAPTIAALARKLAAPFPNDAGAQNELAEAEYDAKNFAAAEAAADRALAADPKSIHAMLYKGMAQQAVLVRDKIDDPARWQAARKWYLAANKIDTEDPEPLIQFFDSYGEAKQPATKNAQNGLLYAYALAPYDASVRIRTAQVLISLDKEKLARIALGPVAYNFEAAGSAEVAQKALKALDAGDKAGAIKALVPVKEEDEDKAKGKGKDGKKGK